MLWSNLFFSLPITYMPHNWLCYISLFSTKNACDSIKLIPCPCLLSNNLLHMIPRHVTPLLISSVSHDLTFLKDRLSQALMPMSDWRIWMHFSAIFLQTKPFMQLYLILLQDTDRSRFVWNATGILSCYDTYLDLDVDRLLPFLPSTLLSPSNTNPFNLFLDISHPSIVIMSDILWF